MKKYYIFIILYIMNIIVYILKLRRNLLLHIIQSLRTI